MLKHEVVSVDVWAELLIIEEALRSIVLYAWWSLVLVPPAPTQSASNDIKIIVKFLENS